MTEAFFSPVPKSVLRAAGQTEGTFAKTMRIHSGRFPDLKDVRVALIGTGHNANLCRTQLYKLSDHTGGTVIADLGDLKHDGSKANQMSGLSECLINLLEQHIIPIVIGQTHSYADALLKSLPFRKVDYSLVSPYLAWREGETARAFFDKNRLLHVASIGVQQFLNNRSLFQEGADMFSEVLRLGELSRSIAGAEALMRQSDVFEFDMRSIRAGEFSSAGEQLPNGLQNREACALCRYAGLSDICTIYLLNHLNLTEGNTTDAMQSAQMIWYILDGIDSRFRELPALNNPNFTVYKCHAHTGEEMTFICSEVSGRWWMQMPATGKKRMAARFIGCTEEEHRLAEQGEVPEKWYRAMMPE